MMIPILEFFNGITHSYGVAIIFLTLVIRGLIFPLSMKQYASMKAMQELQPKMKELQAKYKDNPQELNQALMAFYQENKVNPFGGCLPLLIQMPFLIALYSTLISKQFTDKVGHQGFLFIEDLTRVGFVGNGTLFWDNIMMVVVFGVTTFITQKMMMTDPNDPMQKQMLYMMPIMITVMFVFIPLPAGVLLYTVFSNFFTMGQYLVLKRMYPTTSPPSGGQTIDVSPIKPGSK
ncbi:MAG: YidC/Oxa1 family membrane protein insertase [Candidatus Sericytochromatia bacterium]